MLLALHIDDVYTEKDLFFVFHVGEPWNPGNLALRRYIWTILKLIIVLLSTCKMTVLRKRSHCKQRWIVEITAVPFCLALHLEKVTWINISVNNMTVYILECCNLNYRKCQNLFSIHDNINPLVALKHSIQTFHLFKECFHKEYWTPRQSHATF